MDSAHPTLEESKLLIFAGMALGNVQMSAILLATKEERSMVEIDSFLRNQVKWLRQKLPKIPAGICDAFTKITLLAAAEYKTEYYDFLKTNYPYEESNKLGIRAYLFAKLTGKADHEIDPAILRVITPFLH